MLLWSFQKLFHSPIQNRILLGAVSLKRSLSLSLFCSFSIHALFISMIVMFGKTKWLMVIACSDQTIYAVHISYQTRTTTTRTTKKHAQVLNSKQFSSYKLILRRSSMKNKNWKPIPLKLKDEMCYISFHRKIHVATSSLPHILILN